MSKKRKPTTNYSALGFFVGFLANTAAGLLATFFGLSGALFYGRKLDGVDLCAVVIGLALLLGAAYFGRRLVLEVRK